MRELSTYSPGNPNQPTYARQRDLPRPAKADLLPSDVAPVDWWACDYCGTGECNLRVTTAVEVMRYRAHAAICAKRPDTDPVGELELEAFRALFGKSCIRQMDAYLNKMRKLHRRLAVTWWPPARRKIRRRLESLDQQRHMAAMRLQEISRTNPRDMVISPFDLSDGLIDQA